MGFTIGKRMTAYPYHAVNEVGAPNVFAGGGSNLPKVGSVLTCSTGRWLGLGSQNPKFQWYSGTASIANATNQSFSVQSAGNYFLTCRHSAGNQTWGTWYRDISTGTVQA
jgi:hypothetical protein